MTEKRIVNEDRLNLLFDGDTSLLMQIYDIVIEDFPQLCDKLETAIQAVDFDLIHRHAHTLKGSLANVGGDKASAQAVEIDEFSSSRNIEACKSNFHFLKDAVMEFLTEFKALIDRGTQ